MNVNTRFQTGCETLSEERFFFFFFPLLLSIDGKIRNGFRKKQLILKEIRLKGRLEQEVGILEMLPLMHLGNRAPRIPSKPTSSPGLPPRSFPYTNVAAFHPVQVS